MKPDPLKIQHESLNKNKSLVKTINIIHPNTRSIKKNHDEMVMVVLECILESPPAAICLSETWLRNDDNPFFSIPGRSEMFSKCRGGRDGGVVIQVRQDIVVVKTLSIELDESVLIELNYKIICFQVGVVFSPPTGNKQDCLDNSNSFLSSFQSSSMPIIVCGYLNVDVI